MKNKIIKKKIKKTNYFRLSLGYYKIETGFKCIAQLFNEATTYDR